MKTMLFLLVAWLCPAQDSVDETIEQLRQWNTRGIEVAQDATQTAVSRAAWYRDCFDNAKAELDGQTIEVSYRVEGLTQPTPNVNRYHLQVSAEWGDTMFSDPKGIKHPASFTIAMTEDQATSVRVGDTFTLRGKIRVRDDLKWMGMPPEVKGTTGESVGAFGVTIGTSASHGLTCYLIGPEFEFKKATGK